MQAPMGDRNRDQQREIDGHAAQQGHRLGLRLAPAIGRGRACRSAGRRPGRRPSGKSSSRTPAQRRQTSSSRESTSWHGRWRFCGNRAAARRQTPLDSSRGLPRNASRSISSRPNWVKPTPREPSGRCQRPSPSSDMNSASSFASRRGRSVRASGRLAAPDLPGEMPCRAVPADSRRMATRTCRFRTVATSQRMGRPPPQSPKPLRRDPA